MRTPVTYSLIPIAIKPLCFFKTAQTALGHNGLSATHRCVVLVTAVNLKNDPYFALYHMDQPSMVLFALGHMRVSIQAFKELYNGLCAIIISKPTQYQTDPFQWQQSHHRLKSMVWILD